MTSTSLVLCVSVLYITSSAGSQYHEHMDMKTHSQARPEIHVINRRQVGSSQCYKLAVHELCTNGAFQDYASVFQKCNDSAIANALQAQCKQNSMGRFCTEDVSLKEDIKNACNNSSNSSCSSECKDVLITIRSELGCCIASLYNDSNVVISHDPISFSYSLWSSCGVEPVQECPPSTITLPPVQVDPTCSGNSSVKYQLASLALCRHQFIDPVINLGCPNVFTELSCRANSMSTYCPVLTNISRIALWSCGATSTCDSFCTETLNTAGCCFDQLVYTLSNYMIHDNDTIWSKCDLQSPGLCELRLVDDHTSQGFVTTTASLVTTEGPDETQTGT